MKKLTAKQKAVAVMQGAVQLNALVSAGAVFSIKEPARAQIAAKLETASNAEAVASLFFDDDDEDEEIENAGYRVSADGTAIIPIYGVMVDIQPAWWLSWFGLTSTPQLTQWARQAKADANVKRTYLHIISPGGDLCGMATLADAVFDISASGKPVWAMCDEACSGGYFVGSQADKMIARRDGDIGCIGTRALVYDWSENYKAEGIRAVPITSDGAEQYKIAGARGTVVTPEQEANWKRYANEGQTLFNEAIARGRGVSVKKAQEWADGRYYLGYVALGMGLVDEVGDPDEMLAKFADTENNTKSAPPNGEDANAYEASRRKNGRNAVQYKLNAAKPAQTGTNTVDELIKKAKAALFGGNEPAEVQQDAAAHTIADLTTKLGQAESERDTARASLAKYQTDEKNKNADALNAAKANAKAAALSAKGQGGEGLTEANALIDAQTDTAVLATLTRGFQFEAKSNGVPNTTRQSGGNDPSTDADMDGLEAKLKAAKEAGEKANKPITSGGSN